MRGINAALTGASQPIRYHVRVRVVDRSKPDRTETIAAFVRICRNADRMELIRAIILRWPDITLHELCWGGLPTL